MCAPFFVGKVETIEFIRSLVAYLLIALGSALTIKATLGVGSFMALTVALANCTGLSVGMLLILLEMVFFVICLLLEQHFELKGYGLMLVAVFFSGVTTDLALNIVSKVFSPESYGWRMFSFLIGLGLLGIGNGRVLRYGMLTFPIEKWCLLVSQRTKYSFKFYRYGIDIFCVSSALLLAGLHLSPLVIREGTVISMLFLAPIITWASRIH